MTEHHEEAERHSFIDREHWKADIGALVVMVVVWLVLPAFLSSLVGLDPLVGVIVALVGGALFMAADVAQGWVWRRARRWPK